jgi:uncharacterized membrane protein
MPAELLDDGFGALARDSAHVDEVQHRLQASLAGLMHHPDEGLRNAAFECADEALRRALQSMDFAPDRARLRAFCVRTAAPARHPDLSARRLAPK